MRNTWLLFCSLLFPSSLPRSAASVTATALRVSLFFFLSSCCIVAILDTKMATNGKATATNSLPHVDAAMIMNDEVTPAAPAVEEELEQTVEQLQQHVAALQDKCGRLQAQNILVSVQQLDWLARAIAWSLSAVTVCYYWKLLLWIAPWLGQCYDWTASSESWASTLIFVVESPVLLLQQLCPPMMWEHLISPLLGWIGKAIIFGWPFLHHRALSRPGLSPIRSLCRILHRPHSRETLSLAGTHVCCDCRG